MKTFQERINELRKELIQSIVTILKENGLERLELSENLENPTYVIWNEPQQGIFYDSQVYAVAIHKDGISIDVEDGETEFADTLYSCHGDLGCVHLDWLESIRENILETIHQNNVEKNKNAIELTILGNGNLEITVSNKEEFEEIISKEFQDERHYLAELLENSRYIGNDWYCPYEIGLSEAPAIGQGAIHLEEENENDGQPVDYENVWFYEPYQIRSYIEKLQTEGKVIFMAHNDNLSKKQKHD